MSALEQIHQVPEHMKNVLKTLQDWQSRVQNELDSWKPGHAPKKDLAQQIDQVTKGTTALAREMRSWVGTIKKVTDNLSLEDKVRVSIKFVMGLSAGDRLKFYNLLSEAEDSRDDSRISFHIGAQP